jgi:hypothetical protein
LFYYDVDLNLPQALLELGSASNQAERCLHIRGAGSVTSVAKSSYHLDHKKDLLF